MLGLSVLTGLSVLIAGFLFAFEGYNSSRQNGWEYGGDGVFAKDG